MNLNGPMPSASPEAGRSAIAIALLVLVLLIVGASVIWYFGRGRVIPETRFEPDLEALPGKSEAQVFVGCLGQTGDADTYQLSVSRAEQPEPLPPGTPIPRKPDRRAGVPLTGGTPEQPPVAGTGEPPVGGTPVTRVATYVLVGSGGLQLADHVGHTLEVTGVPDSSQELEFPQLQVSSARHVAPNCGEP